MGWWGGSKTQLLRLSSKPLSVTPCYWSESVSVCGPTGLRLRQDRWSQGLCLPVTWLASMVQKEGMQKRQWRLSCPELQRKAFSGSHKLNSEAVVEMVATLANLTSTTPCPFHPPELCTSLLHGHMQSCSQNVYQLIKHYFMQTIVHFCSYSWIDRNKDNLGHARYMLGNSEWGVYIFKCHRAESSIHNVHDIQRKTVVYYLKCTHKKV